MSEVRTQPRAPLSVVRVQRATMQDDVYRQAKQLILNGELAPGQSITIQWLADAFGVSAMPVREAIVRLTAEGRRAFRTMARTHENWIAQIFSGLDAADIEQLMALLAKSKASARNVVNGGGK